MDWIRRYVRLARIRLTAKRRGPLDIHDVSVVRDRVWLSDVDELRHMNNGVYLMLLDHGRTDLMLRSGGWQKMMAAKVYPVVSAQTIAYRKSLELGQRFDVESRIVGYDDKAVYMEQRIVRDGEVYARAYVQGRFLRMSGGVASADEVGRVVGVDVTQRPIPEWMRAWADQIKLPSTREPAPSSWVE
jgi:YbgC/YbaW family acyl-CoA thioester hydrolase